jgi:hypothetical protein
MLSYSINPSTTRPPPLKIEKTQNSFWESQTKTKKIRAPYSLG